MPKKDAVKGTAPTPQDKKIEEATDVAIGSLLDSEAEATDVAIIADVADVPAVVSDEDKFLMEASKEEDDTLERYPRLVIDQKGKEATIGSLHCKEMAEEFTAMNVVLLKTDKSRILWPADYDSDNDPLCRSHDGIVPADDIDDQKAMAEACDKCGYSKWGGTKEKPIPPECKDVTDLLIMSTDTFIPMWIACSSTAMKPTKDDLLQPLKLKKMKMTAQRRNIGLSPAHSCMFSFDLSTFLKPNKKGDAYIPVYSNILELDEEMKTQLIQVAMAVRDSKAHNARDMDEEGNDGNAPADDF